MPALFVFLLKVNIALLLFCAGYYLVLRHLTFYTLNRIYLVGAIVFATVYPKINLDNFAQRHQQLTQPVQAMVLNLQAPAETLVKPLAQPVYWQWAEGIFFAGAAFLAIRLMMQLFSLYTVYRNSRSAKIFGHSVRVIDTDGGPFSFWKNIYINPKGYSPSDLYRILLHEQVHADELHTLDVLIAELSIIFYWFNPGIWLMRKAVRENIEFITDRKILQQGIDSKSYQYSLLNVSFATTQPGIANHFNISTLKKRIIMMNSKKSSQANLTRYALLMPVVLLCLLSFSFSKAELIKKGKTTYKALTLSVVNMKDMATANPITKSITVLFQDKAKPAKKAIDTIKIIRSGSRDTIKIVRPSMVTNFVYEQKNGEATVTPEIRNVRIEGHSLLHDTGEVRVMGYGIRRGTYMQGGRVGGKDTVIIKNFTVSSNPKSFNGYNLSPNIQLRAFLKDNNNANDASIIVDGVPLANGDLKSIDPNKITSLSVIKGDAANPHGIIMVSTNSNGNTNTKPGVVYTMGDRKIDSMLNKMKGFEVTKNGTLIHNNDTITRIRINGTNMKNLPIVVMGYPAKKPATIEASIQNLSGKLVFVDGIEVSDKDLKKLPASYIESVSWKAGDEIVKRYGDKAKNGVVFITTRKEK